MTTSPYQEAIYDFMEAGRGDAVVNAVAGSGKTTTLIEASKRLPTGTSSLFAAFNKSIVNELQSRLGEGVVCKTLNAIGHGALYAHLGRNLSLNDKKYVDIIAEATEGLAGEEAREIRQSISQLTSFAQSTLCETTDEDLADLADRYGIDLSVSGTRDEAWFYDATRYTLEAGERMAQDEHVISFNDQTWLPNKWDLACKRYDFIFVDEIQDLSRGKLELILRSRNKGARILGVGDPFQSIYGFAGADPRAWQEIIRRTDATVLPLSVCYRCPTKVVDLAQELVPEIQSAPDAPEGIVEHVTEVKFEEMVATGDLVLCRYTAPLISACIRLISQKIPARVKGRDISKALLGLAREANQGHDWIDFPNALNDTVSKKRAQLSKQKHSEGRIQSLEDRAAGLLACYEAFSVTSFAAFTREVEDLFTDGGAAVELSTIHKAKGLQAKRVFILAPSKLGKGGKLDWEQEQERNLKYVALTRAMSELYFVREAKTVPAIVAVLVDVVALRSRSLP